MKMPKEVKDYCKKCNSHTKHKIKHFKTLPGRTLAKGNRRNIEKKKGYLGKYQFTATVKKKNKKPTFVAQCAECKTKHYIVINKKMKKVELVAA